MSIIERILPFGMGVEALIILLASAAAAIMVFAVWNATRYRDPVYTRLTHLEGRRNELKSGYLRPQQRKSSIRKINKSSVGVMKRILNRVNLMQGLRSRELADELAGAGWRSHDAPVIYMFFKLVLPIIFGLTAVILLYGLNLTSLPSFARMASCFLAVAFGWYAPKIFVKNMTIRRQDEIRKKVPDALDLLVICAEAGLTLDAALTRVAHEIERGAPELADELGLTAIELGFLPERREALDNLARRVKLPAIRGIVGTLAQSEKYGTPLARSLRVLGDEFRTERLLRAEEKAARLPATLTLPLVLFILPSLFVVLIGPAILSIIDEFSRM